jgi:hypothetical protein
MMKNQDKTHEKFNGERVSRRTLLKTGAASAAAMAGLATLTGISAAKGSELNLRVLADPTLLDLISSPVDPNQGPFYIPGEIFDMGTGDSIGIFHCWGFFAAGGAIGVVSQEYDLTGRGKIQVQGVEDEGPRAVTGGTGDYRNVRGEMTGADLSNFPDFTVTFNLIGAGGN